MSHLRHAVRKLSKTPGFTILSVITLASGIAASTTIFGVVNAVLLLPLPFPDAHQLVTVTHDAPGLDLEDLGQSDATFLHYQSHSQALESIALFSTTNVTLTGQSDPQRLRAVRVTPSLFSVLRVVPASGRGFSEDDGRPGAQPVAILTDQLWRRRFGADPAVVGQTIDLDGEPVEVIGILEPGLEFPGRHPDVWVPWTIDPQKVILGRFGYSCIARLRDGVSLAEAQADVERLMRLEEAFPGDYNSTMLTEAGFKPRTIGFQESVVGGVKAMLWILFGAVAFVLLIAFANVANLFLVRAEGRIRETALRTALGATRARLSAGALAESLALATVAGTLGFLAAGAGIRLLVRFGPQDLPGLARATLDGRTLAFTVIVSLFLAVAFGLIPVFRSPLRQLAVVLKEGGRAATPGRSRHRIRHSLVAVQIAFAFILLIGSGLMMRSFERLSGVDPGFRSSGLLTLQLTLPERSYPDDESAARFYTELAERLAALPGVDGVGAVSSFPLIGANSSGHQIEDFPPEPGGMPLVFDYSFVTPGYFRTMGIPLRQGRVFDRSDHESRTGVMLISESLARHYWPDESPLGKRLNPGRMAANDEDPWYTVVGVVGDVHASRLSEEPGETVYYPILGKTAGNWRAGQMKVVIQVDGAPMSVLDAVRRELRAIDPNLPIAGVRTVDEIVREARAPMAFTATLLLIAALMSLLLGAVGTFGVISYVVGQRTSEIGVRVALGASRRDIRQLILRDGLLLAGLGAVAGIAGAVGLTGWLESLLYQVSPLDPATFATVLLILIGVVLLASWVPARRASRVDPMVALRHE